MKVYREIGLEEFEPWGGAEDRFNMIQEDDQAWDELLDLVESVFGDDYVSESELNDFIWFNEGVDDIVDRLLGENDSEEEEED